MGKLSWIGEPGVLTSEPAPGQGRALDDGALLAAALAATLVAYRREVDRAGGGGAGPGETGRTNWQIAGRLEQLRGRA